VCIDMITHFNQTPYQFGNGNPMYWADPSGLDGVTTFGKGGASLSESPFAAGNAACANTGVWGGGGINFNPMGFNSGSGWGDGGLLATTYTGDQARAVFSYIASLHGFTSYMYPDAESTVPGGMGVGFYQKKAPSYFQGYFDGTPSGEYGPSMGPTARELATGMQNLGDGMSLLGAGLSLSILGAEVGIPMMAIGGQISLIGTVLELGIDTYETGSIPIEKTITKLAMEVIPFVGNKTAAKVAEEAMGRLVESSTIILDRCLDSCRDNKIGPYLGF
jgi:hypothetical protein